MSTAKPDLVPDSPQVPDQNADMPLYLKEWRKHRGMTGAELAAKIGTAKSYVSKWETGERPLRDINWITKICAVLEITQEQLRKMPVKSQGKLTHSSQEASTFGHTADVVVSPEGLDMIDERLNLIEAIDELPDELIPTARKLVERLKGLRRAKPPHPSRRGSSKP